MIKRKLKHNAISNSVSILLFFSQKFISHWNSGWFAFMPKYACKKNIFFTRFWLENPTSSLCMVSVFIHSCVFIIVCRILCALFTWAMYRLCVYATKDEIPLNLDIKILMRWKRILSKETRCVFLPFPPKNVCFKTEYETFHRYQHVMYFLFMHILWDEKMVSFNFHLLRRQNEMRLFVSTFTKLTFLTNSIKLCLY